MDIKLFIIITINLFVSVTVSSLFASQSFSEIHTAPAAAPDDVEDCGGAEGWIQYEDHCYYIGALDTDNKLFTWYEARDWCLQVGAYLATIEDQDEADFIFNLTSTGEFIGSLWIGLNRLDNKDYLWTDGSQAEFTDWVTYQPNGDNNDKYGMCVNQLTHPLKKCMDNLDSISTIEGLFSRPSDTVPGERFYFGYKYNSNPYVNRAVCEKDCLDAPGCNSFTFITSAHPDYVWRSECMGSNDAQRIRVPNNYSLSGERVACEGKWIVSNCAERNGFICKRMTNSTGGPITVPTKPPTTGFCPSDYFEGQGGKCYKIVEKGHNEGVIWSDAVSLCRAGPGVNPDIASIHSDVDNAIISMNMPDFTRGLWIGLQMQTTVSPWSWTDNSLVDYFNWGFLPSPDTAQCVELWSEPGKHGSWKALSCETRSGYICQTYKDDTVHTPPVTLPHSCPSHYVNYGNVCYRMIEAPLRWEEAERQCELEKAQIVSIHSEQENAALLLLAKSIAPFWIGFRMNNDYEWYWTDGWPVQFTRWESGKEPGSLDECAIYQQNTQWMNENCNKTYPTVCRITSEPPPSTPTVNDGYCPDRWISRGSHCYFFSTPDDGMKSWDSAQRDCVTRAGVFSPEDIPGGLVSIHSKSENEFVYEQTKARGISDIWIGLYKTAHEMPHEWTDGTVLDYTRWAPGEPNDKNGSQLCTEMYINLFPGLWNDHLCPQLRNYVCKAKQALSTPSTPFAPPGLRCPEGCRWKSRGQFCYYMDLTTKLNFLEAQQECVKQAGHTARLAGIPDPETNLFLMDSIRQDSSAYNRIWIGLVQKQADEPFRWMDGSVLNFSYWAEGEPNNQGEDEYCAEITYPSGLWNDMNCVSNRLSFICQVSKVDLGIKIESSDQDQGDSVYELSHGEMAGVVIGSMLCTLFVALVILIVYGLITGYRPEVLERITEQKYPKVRRKEPEYVNKNSSS